MYRISDTAHVPVYLCKVTPPCHLHHTLSERISDTLMWLGLSLCHQHYKLSEYIGDTLMWLVLCAGFATRGCFG